MPLPGTCSIRLSLTLRLIIVACIVPNLVIYLVGVWVDLGDFMTVVIVALAFMVLFSVIMSLVYFVMWSISRFIKWAKTDDPVCPCPSKCACGLGVYRGGEN